MTPSVPRNTVEPSETSQVLDILRRHSRDIEKLQRGTTLRYSSISGGDGQLIYDDDGKLRLSIDSRGSVTAYDAEGFEVARYGRLVTTAPGQYGVEILVDGGWVRLGYQTTGWAQIQKPSGYDVAADEWDPSPHQHQGTDISGTVPASTTAQQADGVTSGAYGRDIGSMTGAHFAVWMTDNGFKLGRNTSSIRYKENVRPTRMDPSRVLALQPVVFDRKPVVTPPAVGIGPDRVETPRKDEWGLIAEEVAKHVPELVTYFDGQIDGVRYDLLALALLDVVKDQAATLKGQAQQIAALAEHVGLALPDTTTGTRK